MYDLAYFLSAAETDIASNGSFLTVDLDDYLYTGGDYQPNNVMDVMKAVVPRFSTLVSTIKSNFQMYPTYCVTGMKTAALLRSLQEMMVTMGSQRGDMGWSGGTAQFMKLKILESYAIGNDRIYLSTKAPDNDLSKTAIADLIYNPLYIVPEVTDKHICPFL